MRMILSYVNRQFRLRRLKRDYRTLIVTTGLVWPAMPITTGTSSPGVTSAGTLTLTWYKPAKPGVSPENKTRAGLWPMVTVGIPVWLRGAAAAAAPFATGGLTAPRPA